MTSDDYERKTKKWVKITITLLFLTGLFIGLAVQKEKCIDTYKKLNDNILSAFSSSLQIKEQSYGLIMFDLEEKDEEISWVDIVSENVIQCESQNQMVWGDLNYYENGVNIKSYGVAQFQERTFNYLKGLAHADKLNYYDREDQEWLLKWAIEHDYGFLWSCYRKLYL